VKRRLPVLLFGFLAALVLALVGLADTGKGERIRFNAADQAAARAATIHKTDLPAHPTWTGGSRKPDLSPPVSCPNYLVDLSGFVLTGAAQSRWSIDSFEVETKAKVFQTAQMARQEWRIRVEATGAIACLRRQIAKELAARPFGGLKLVSFKQIAFPHIAPYTAAFRLETTTRDGAPVAFAVVRLGRSRTEITLMVSNFAEYWQVIRTAAVQHARIVAGRIKA
jgi:hypothetical protein